VRGYTRARHVGGLVLGTVLAITIGALITSTGDPTRVIPAGAATLGPRPPDTLQQLLTKQAAAVNRGDLSGWLAPVAPPLRPRYQNLFRTLRALHATVDYRAGKDGTAVLTYCFSPTCPQISPKIGQSVKMKPLPGLADLPLGAPGNPNTSGVPEAPSYAGG